MGSRKCLAVLVLIVALPLAACGGPATQAPPPTTAPKVKAPEPPKWMNGEYPKQDSFFGHAAVPLTDGDKAAAIDRAREQAVANIALELELLNKIVKDDHEEQVAEIISRYPPEDFNKFADQAKAASLAKVVVAEEHVDQSTTPPTLHVLFALPADAFHDALLASELPDEQKKRIGDYRQTFTDNVMENLARR